MSAVAMAVLLVAATVAPGTIDPQVLAEKGPQDPSTFGGALLADQTMQPTRASLWLRPPPPGPGVR
jgi:hypothetical protein